MSDLNEIFQTQSLTQVSNYSGVYQTGIDYQKFDFVNSAEDGMFYYAREDIPDAGNLYIENSFRISLVPNGPSTSQGRSHYIVDAWNQSDALGAEFKVGQFINLSGSEAGADGLYKVLNIQKDLTSVNNDPNLTGSALNVIGVGDAEITQLELDSSNLISLSAIAQSPDEDSTSWSRDLFFFDADYGSTVNFKANNYRYDYGNGYYILQPKNVNSLTFEVDLKFKNRTNREANAIIHFIENHQGQHEQDQPSPNLQYTLGISGFRWDGNATFHPYDSIDMQTKKFYCSDFSHALNFENSNDVTVKLRNLDTSIMQKSESLFVRKAEDYSSNQFYEKNDVVFVPDNHRYYYWHNDTSFAGKNPVGSSAEWSREDGLFKDENTDCWTRDFKWRPSIGLTVPQKIRLKELSVGAGYSQVYRDGINESLLSLDLQFNNRDDSEAYAILHFLEQHYGAVPFMFDAPAPYDSVKNFVCQEWSHTYNYKNNHSISARFEQYPFNYSADQYDNQSAPPPKQAAELAYPNVFVMSEENVGSTISSGDILKKRLILKNLGDFPLLIHSINVGSLGGRNFYTLGGHKVIAGDREREDYIYRLPTNQGLPFGLGGKYIKLSKGYSDGPDGGQAFVVMIQSGEEFVPDGFGAANIYFQNNKGQIKFGNSDYQSSSYFVNKGFFDKNGESSIPAKSEAFIDIVSSPGSNRSIVSRDYRNLLAQGLNLSTSAPGVHFGSIQITTDGLYAVDNGLIKIYVV